MSSKIIQVGIFLLNVFHIIYAKCYLEKESLSITCHNTSIDSYINDLFVGLEEQEFGNFQQLTIRNSNFSFINSILNPLKILRITDFSKNYGKKNKNIDILRLNLCNIKFIEPKAFDDFNDLTELDLGFNYIEKIRFISNLPSTIKKVNLTNNRIKKVDFELFSHEINSLDLSFNKITFISVKSMNDYWPLVFPIREFLYLNNNNIYKIYVDSVQISDTLQVNLAYNNITNIEYDKKLHGRYLNLNSLDLSQSVFDLRIFYINNINLRITNLILANNKKIDYLAHVTFSNYKNIDFSNCSLRYIHSSVFEQSRFDSINFSYNNLISNNESMFNGSTIDNLNLAFNKIENVNNVFEYTRIKKLNLSSNKITELNSLSFKNVKDLFWLDLSYNNIKLSKNSFSNCPSLKILNLSSSNISEYEDLAFNNLTYLKSLNLYNNSLRFLKPNIFKPLVSIIEINLNNNQLAVLDSYVFSNLPLELINISKNEIEIIKPNAFCNLSDLRVININNNKQKMLIEDAAFSNLLSNLQIYIKNSKISQINWRIFSNLPKLDLFDVRNNNITSIIFLNNSNHIKELYITFNGKIGFQSFSNLIFLEKLKFLNSEITTIGDKAFNGLINLEILEFENTNVHYLELGALDGLFKTKKLDLKNMFKNKRNLIGHMFKNLFSIVNLNLSNMKLENLMSYTFEGLISLNKLNLSNNNINNFQICTFCGVKHLNELDLSTNSLVILKHDDFEGLESLRILNLNSNNINDMELGALQNFPSLEVLLLAKNNLTEFKVGAFSNLLLLETLDLQKNSISTLLFESFLPLRSLTYLNLEHNNLKSIGHFSLVSNFHSLKRIAINKNKWKCDYLAEMLVIFKKHNIDYSSKYLNFYDNNINGIDCIDICKYLLCLKDSHGIN